MSNQKIWLYIILYIVFLGGLLYLMKFVTILPYLLLLSTTFLCYLIYKGKLKALAQNYVSSTIGLLLFVIVIAAIPFLAKPYKYNSFIGQYLVSGKMVTRTVLVEADEGPNTWEEERTYWQPETKFGKTMMDIIGWINFAIVISCFIFCLKFYLKTSEKEDKGKNNRYTSNFS